MGYWVPLANAARRGVLPRLTAAARTLCVDTTALRQIWRRSGRRWVGSRGNPKRSRTQCVQRVGARDKSNVTVASYQSDSQDEKLGRLHPNAEPWAPAGACPRTEVVEDPRSSADRVRRDRTESAGGAGQAR